MRSRDMHVINNTKLSGLSQPVRVIAKADHGGQIGLDFDHELARVGHAAQQVAHGMPDGSVWP